MFSFQGAYLPDEKLCYHYHVQDFWIHLKSSFKIGNCNFESSVKQLKVLNQIRNKVHPECLF